MAVGMQQVHSRPWRPIHVALLAVPAIAVALVLWQGRRSREDPGQILAALRAQSGPRLPPVAAGARSATEPERYDRATLYELVDGAAEAYLARGFERCVAATYLFPAAGGIEVAAEVYRFQDERGARAHAESERPAAAAPVPAAPDAVTDGQVLLAVAGRDLLKLTALSADPRGRDLLVALAAAWAKERP